MFFRIYFIFKCLFNYSIYNDAYSKKLCKEYGFYPGLSFMIKTKFVKNPNLMLVFLFILTVFIFSFTTYVFEVYYMMWPGTTVALSGEQGTQFNVLYLVVMTITTVGFGDYTAKTYPGKIIIILTALWGAIMISFFVLVMSNIFNL